MAWELYNYTPRRRGQEFVTLSPKGVVTISTECCKKHRLHRFAAARIHHDKGSRSIKFELLEEKSPPSCPLRDANGMFTVVCGPFVREIGAKPGHCEVVWDEETRTLLCSYTPLENVEAT